MKRTTFLFALLFLLVLPGTALAHGLNVQYRTQNSIEITAIFDGGTPAGGGQVNVYAPDNPSTPWTKGKCDEKGRFTFTPDPGKPGTWDVQVRLAGHGGIIHIPLGEKDAREAQSGGTGFSTLQIVIMSASVAWGLLGTALFFSRRKS